MKSTTNAESENQSPRAWCGAYVMVAALWLALPQTPLGCQAADDSPRGQSGSENRGGSGPISNDTESCPCDAAGVYLRATVLQKDGSDLLLRVDEVIHGDTPLRAGQEIRASWNGDLPCYVGQSSIDAGEEALVAFTPAERTLESCDASDCTQADGARGNVRLTAWADELLLAQTARATLTVPASELALVWGGDRGQCLARHGDWAGLPGALDGVAP